MRNYENVSTHRLMIIAALYMEVGRPLPADLVLTLNTRGIVFNEEELIT